MNAQPLPFKPGSRLSVEPSMWWGSGYPTGTPIDVYDADGGKIDVDWIVYVDVETGVVIFSVRDRLDNPVIAPSGALKYRVEVYKPPLRLQRFAKSQLFVPKL